MSMILKAESALRAKLKKEHQSELGSIDDNEEHVEKMKPGRDKSKSKTSKRTTEKNEKDDDQSAETKGKEEQRAKIRRKDLMKVKIPTDPKTKGEKSNVIYIGHLPMEFQERELFLFLKQFGRVKHVRLSRSKYTNRSRGYAFCQMKSPDVAAIVADTLSGYIMMGQKRLVCNVVPPEQIHKYMLHVPLASKKHLEERRKSKTPATRSLEKMRKITKRLLSRQEKKRLALKEKGIDYDFPGYQAPAESAEGELSEDGAKPSEKESSSSDERTSSKNPTSTDDASATNESDGKTSKSPSTESDSAAATTTEDNVTSPNKAGKKKKPKKRNSGTDDELVPPSNNAKNDSSTSDNTQNSKPPSKRQRKNSDTRVDEGRGKPSKDLDEKINTSSKDSSSTKDMVNESTSNLSTATDQAGKGGKMLKKAKKADERVPSSDSKVGSHETNTEKNGDDGNKTSSSKTVGEKNTDTASYSQPKKANKKMKTKKRRKSAP